ncbi:TPA: N-glycosylase [Candidatus Dependentiae bacterium]|nr:MAG: N-glycosylase/DNA lyase [candidate division TM6 bacterium GW2011_GWE2_31_21]KKP53600.1 MAG: N-glycosylase/DNA lyase [candidate division TM6 bacterium GW2011_GWF2_33_332]HBS48160.1 N-glycosylase [Candidatus Dependentiae bacterium]HBZ73584.1 N-glycosylase [Candidatus Dependentiae bacterium]
MNKIQKIKSQFIKNNLIKKRLAEFKSFKDKTTQEWFSELCFCLLTANSKAKTALAIQQEMGNSGFTEKPQEELSATIRKHNHRFHNKKAEYIIAARSFITIKDEIFDKKGPVAREFLVKNIKGLGFKEASHFLRNVGFADVAIIDRHILRFLKQNEFIKDIPATITKSNYLKYEKILKGFKIPLDELDLIIWQKMTGEVLK